MKIAFVSDDEITISAHFGRAAWYVVLTVQDGKVTCREKRGKTGHAQFAGESHPGGSGTEPHGFDPASQERHRRMVNAIADCQVLVARGMGQGAAAHLKAMGIQPLLTELPTIDRAAEDFLQGRLVHRPERLH